MFYQRENIYFPWMLRADGFLNLSNRCNTSYGTQSTQIKTMHKNMFETKNTFNQEYKRICRGFHADNVIKACTQQTCE